VCNSPDSVVHRNAIPPTNCGKLGVTTAGNIDAKLAIPTPKGLMHPHSSWYERNQTVLKFKSQFVTHPGNCGPKVKDIRPDRDM